MMIHSCCSPSRSSGRKETRDPTVALPQAMTVAAGRGETVLLDGGSFLMGTDYPNGFTSDGEGPVRTVSLSPFQIGRFAVTNHEFEQFIRATGYVTDAERFGWSFVFWSHVAQERFENLVEDTAANAPWWCKVAGAKWSQPEGLGSEISTRMNHPAVHVSWNDARAYCSWAECQLPTEAQWEYAARGGLEQKLFPWGDELTPANVHLCNIWQGEFPLKDTAEDGYSGTCPVDAFPANGFGLYCMTGNVWEWCSDWFTTQGSTKPYIYNPAGPAQGHTKVLKGGSFLCHESYCNRYRVASRTANAPETSASNIGFRAARVLAGVR